jgi:signal peptidase II
MILRIVAPLIILDQFSKYLVTRYLSLHQSVPVIPGIFHLTLVHNRGAAFGIMKNQVPVFIATSLFAVYLIYTSLRKSKQKAFSLYEVSLCLILAGALGNLIDRVRVGYVIDFLDFRIWPVFNIADSAITVGAVLLAFSMLKERRR